MDLKKETANYDFSKEIAKLKEYKNQLDAIKKDNQNDQIQLKEMRKKK